MFNIAYWLKKKTEQEKHINILKSAGHHKKHTRDKCEISQAPPKEKILLILQQVSVKTVCLQYKWEGSTWNTPERPAPLLSITALSPVHGQPRHDKKSMWREFSDSFHHCCQLKSSLLPKTKKKPRIVAKMTVFPVRTSAQAPHSIKFALANTIGRPKAETTMPVVRNMASSLQALLIASVSSTSLLAMQYGIGERI